MREVQWSLERKCPFCRTPLPKSKHEADQNDKKRAEANNPVAIREMSARCFEKGDYSSALEYLTKAAGLRDTEAHYQLSCLYKEGRGVEKDMKKAVYHWEEAAIGGHPQARYNLGVEEGHNDNFERAVRHFIIAANLGHDYALKLLTELHAAGAIRKDDFDKILHAHQAAVNATKSPERDEAERKRKHVAELREKILFRQPNSSYLGDCPICFLPLSADMSKCVMRKCCSKLICNGCAHVYRMRENNRRCGNLRVRAAGVHVRKLMRKMGRMK